MIEKYKPIDALNIGYNREEEYAYPCFLYQGLPIIAPKTKKGGELIFNNEFYTVTSVNDTTFACKSDRHENEF
jgi:hypothetical protein